MGQVQRGDRASLQPAHLPSHWPELALITGLATSTVLLAIVCAALIRRIHRLQARLREFPRVLYGAAAVSFLLV